MDYLKASSLLDAGRAAQLAKKPDEAKAIYNEIITKYGKTGAMTEAQVRLAELTSHQFLTRIAGVQDARADRYDRPVVRQYQSSSPNGSPGGATSAGVGVGSSRRVCHRWMSGGNCCPVGSRRHICSGCQG